MMLQFVFFYPIFVKDGVKKATSFFFSFASSDTLSIIVELTRKDSHTDNAKNNNMWKKLL